MSIKNLQLNASSEGFFENEYQKLDLPAIWRVIYHEGIRHNHILFSAREMESIEGLLLQGGFKLDDADKSTLLKVGSHVFTCANFSLIKLRLAQLSDTQKAVFFILYKRALSHWGRKFRATLN